MKRVCCPRNLVYEASFRKKKKKEGKFAPLSKFSTALLDSEVETAAKVGDLFTKLIIGVRVTRQTCDSNVSVDFF